MPGRIRREGQEGLPAAIDEANVNASATLPAVIT
jgi:hypothetical protein